MVTYEELHTQNHKITELTNILSRLLEDRILCDSEVTCDLFYRYVDTVKKHLNTTDAGLYARLLSAGDQHAQNTARKFMSGSQEIKRIFASYLKKWCQPKNQKLKIRDHDEFLRETNEMFQMVLDRILDETEHLYPLIREITGDAVKAA